MADLTLTHVGQRIYLSGNTFPVKDQIKALGGHWDGDRKQWWVGVAKRAEIEAAIAKAAVTTPASSASNAAPQGGASREKPSHDAQVKARATYKGRDYYVLAETRDGAKLLLAARNGEFQFWAATSTTQITKTYGHENYRSRRTEYPTLGSMMRLAEKWRQMPTEEREQRSQPLEEGYYYGEGGEVLASGCSECRRLGTMCRSCQHDYE